MWLECQWVTSICSQWHFNENLGVKIILPVTLFSICPFISSESNCYLIISVIKPVTLAFGIAVIKPGVLLPLGISVIKQVILSFCSFSIKPVTLFAIRLGLSVVLTLLIHNSNYNVSCMSVCLSASHICLS